MRRDEDPFFKAFWAWFVVAMLVNVAFWGAVLYLFNKLINKA